MAVACFSFDYSSTWRAQPADANHPFPAVFFSKTAWFFFTRFVSFALDARASFPFLRSLLRAFLVVGGDPRARAHPHDARTKNLFCTSVKE